MDTNNKIFSIIIVIILITANSCSDDYLFLEPHSSQSAAGFYKTIEDINQAVSASYDALQFNGQYGFNFTYFMEIPADNAVSRSITNSGGIYGDFELFRVTPLNAVIDATWTDCYKGIQRCNIVLNRIQDIDMDDEIKGTRIGEMKFIRALTYFNLVRIWGDVPLVLEEIDDPLEAFKHERTNVEIVYDQIITDLQDAIDALPENYPESENGRVTKGAATAILAKVYLTTKDYNAANSNLAQLIASDNYALLDNYADIFDVSNKNNQEIIFKVQYMKGGFGEGSSFANNFAPAGDNSVIGGVGIASGDNEPTIDLYNAYADGDKRKNTSIDTTESGQMFTMKYNDIPFQQYDADNNFIVIRYADVLLMAAEVLNELSYQPDGEAFTLLNQIRIRAGISSLSSGDLPDKESFRRAVENERRLELAFENHRWFDLIRTGKAIEVMSDANSPHGDLEILEYRLLFPVPQSQIDAINDKTIFDQNIGYN